MPTPIKYAGLRAAVESIIALESNDERLSTDDILDMLPEHLRSTPRDILYKRVSDARMRKKQTEQQASTRKRHPREVHVGLANAIREIIACEVSESPLKLDEIISLLPVALRSAPRGTISTHIHLARKHKKKADRPVEQRTRQHVEKVGASHVVYTEHDDSDSDGERAVTQAVERIERLANQATVEQHVDAPKLAPTLMKIGNYRIGLHHITGTDETKPNRTIVFVNQLEIDERTGKVINRYHTFEGVESAQARDLLDLASLQQNGASSSRADKLRMHALEQEIAQLRADNEQMQRDLETMTARALAAESENDTLTSIRNLLNKRPS